MQILGLSTQLKVRQCSQCQGDTEFYCNTCKRDLCILCKERHVIDLDSKYHDVVIYREKYDCIPLNDNCVRHPSWKYEMFCQPCRICMCFACSGHRTHTFQELRRAYKSKRQQHKEIIQILRSETFYNCRVLLAGIQTDIQICHQQICHCQSHMLTKAQKLKDLIDTMVCDFQTRYRGLLIARIQQQKRKMNRQLTQIQHYEYRCEQSANRAVQFLLFIKINHVPRVDDTPNLPQHLLLSLTQGLKTNEANQVLRGILEIKMITEKRQVGIDDCVKLAPTPVLHTHVYVTGVKRIGHISGVTSDRVWVSEYNNLILTDKNGDTIHRVTNITILSIAGLHTVSSSGELIYIDSDYNIQKLSIDNKTVTTLLVISSPWRPQCVHYSPSTGDLFVGMYNSETDTGQIARFSCTGQFYILAIQTDDECDTLYRYPVYITENKNGDIIVSDWHRDAVVVSECGGRHRFSYTGREQGKTLWPQGICTDALSHILVCDTYTHTIQMIDEDGHFLSLLLTPSHGISRPYSLNYDDKTHLLWVGSEDTNTVSVYRYIYRRYSLTGSQLRALYDFSARCEDELTIKEGDILYLLDDSNTDRWLARHANPSNSSTKIDGYVPKKYVIKKLLLGSYEWFMGPLKRKETERMLLSSENEAGSFLIRESKTSAGKYVLSVRDYQEAHGDTVQHYLIHSMENDQGYFIETNTVMPSLPELVKHYSGHSDVLCQTLSQPCKRLI